MTADYSDFDFDNLEDVTIPVRYKGIEYELREATGQAVKLYNNARTSRIKFGSNGKVQSVTNIGDLEPYLVSLCLFHVETNKPVDIRSIEKFPGRMVKRLHDKAKEISDIEEEDATRTQTLEAFQRDDSPITLEALREWVQTLPDEFKPVRELLKPTAEEKAKNEQSSTTDGLS